jgi:hypothetical protein
MVLNTAAIVLFQVRMSKTAKDLKLAAKQFQQASFYVALASLIYALSHGVNAVIASIVLIIGMWCSYCWRANWFKCFLDDCYGFG